VGYLPLEVKVELIRAELSIRFPRFAGFVVEHRALDWADVLAVRWTDGPSLFDMRDLALRERYETTRLARWIKSRVRPCYVRYEREYSIRALETTKCTSPWLSYDYTVLEETTFEGPHS
jgi:hypothetical protein